MGYFGFQRSISLRNATMPAASIFAQCAGFKRIARNSSFSSGGVGGRPRDFFAGSMESDYTFYKNSLHKHICCSTLITHTNRKQAMNTATFQTGQKVTTSGFKGVVVRMYSAGMVEVRLASGLVCVPASDVVAA